MPSVLLIIRISRDLSTEKFHKTTPPLHSFSWVSICHFYHKKLRSSWIFLLDEKSCAATNPSPDWLSHKSKGGYPSYFYSREQRKSRGLGSELISQPYSKMLKNVHYYSNLCVLSYIVFEDHFLFISCQGNPSRIRCSFLLSQIFSFLKNARRGNISSRHNTQHGTSDYSNMTEFIGNLDEDD